MPPEVELAAVRGHRWRRSKGIRTGRKRKQQKVSRGSQCPAAPRKCDLVRLGLFATVRVGARREQLRNLMHVRLGRSEWDGATRVGRDQPCGQPGRRVWAAARRRAVFFWSQFLHENDMVMQIFAKILPRWHLWIPIWPPLRSYSPTATRPHSGRRCLRNRPTPSNLLAGRRWWGRRRQRLRCRCPGSDPRTR